jgi:predicted TPR repeat methyltransferase
MLNRLKTLLPGTLRPTEASAACKKEGDEKLKAGRLDEAVACYRRAVEVAPGNVDALIGLGFALSEQSNCSEAAACLQRALAIDQRNADAHYILGSIAKERGDDDGAAGHFAAALDAKSDFEFAYRDLYAVLVRSGQVGRAKEIVSRALKQYPESAEFQFHLGNLLSHEGDHDAAVASFRKALSTRPDESEVHKSLADALVRAGKLQEAAASYRKAIWFAPAFVEAHLGLGDVQKRQFPDQAIACYERALELEPRRAGAQMALGSLLESQGRRDDAIACFRRAVEIAPESADAHQGLGSALMAQGATEEAIACFEEALRLDPGNDPVRHMIAALSGRSSERAPSEYVEQLFDHYAQNFDAHLVDVLKYSVPEKLADLLRPRADGSAQWTIVDLGCGTGLSGAAVAPFAKHLVGVDLSAKMLDKARERKLYHRLEQLDLLPMMQGEPASTFDVVFSADVFVYVGALDDLMSEASRLLRPGGYLAFSVESLDALPDGAGQTTPNQDYRLNVTGRYAHSIDYLARMAARNGFEVLTTTETQSRLNEGVPVLGYLCLWRKAGD